MKFDACKSCVRGYSEISYICTSCRDGHHHKSKGEEMRHEEIYKVFEDVVKTHKLTMRIDTDNLTGNTTIKFEDLDKNGYAKTFDKWWKPVCRDNLNRLRDVVDRHYCRLHHYVQVPENHIVIDFDIPDKDGNKDFKRNGVHLHFKNVIFNDPATIIMWADGTKTVVKCQEGDVYDPEKGMAMAICKKALGNQGNYCEVFKKWLPEEEELLSARVQQAIDDATETIRRVSCGDCYNCIGVALNEEGSTIKFVCDRTNDDIDRKQDACVHFVPK